MSSFERVSRDQFEAAIAASPASATFRDRYSAFSPTDYDGPSGSDYQIHRGTLNVSRDFVVPALNFLIAGDLLVDGLLDLENPQGFDEGGLFVAIGNVTCTSFANTYGKCTFVDGNLQARELIL